MTNRCGVVWRLAVQQLRPAARAAQVKTATQASNTGLQGVFLSIMMPQPPIKALFAPDVWLDAAIGPALLLCCYQLQARNKWLTRLHRSWQAD